MHFTSYFFVLRAYFDIFWSYLHAYFRVYKVINILNPSYHIGTYYIRHELSLKFYFEQYYYIISISTKNNVYLNSK